MKSNIKKKKGFTLIELIIVIAIIGILAAIAVPKFGDIQKDSKIKADIATAKTISDAVSVLVTQGVIPEETAGKVTITTADVTNAAAGDAKIAAQIGKYLQSIPESSLAKGTKFSVTVAEGNAVVEVGNVQVYPNAGGDYVN